MQNKIIKIITGIIIFQQSFCLQALAGATNSELEYPELIVTPRATERVTTEASKEKHNRWLVMAPIQLSSISTFAASIQMKTKNSDSAQNAKLLGNIIGGGWLVASIGLAAFYTPYFSTYQDFARLPANTPREKLYRERIAEEGINSAGNLGTRLSLLSVASNLAASLYMMINSSSKGIALTSSILAFTPIVFQSRWQTVAKEQRDYKKRIYGPIASATVFQDPVTHRVFPGLIAQIQF